MRQLLDTPFKGNRHYIHGSDIFNRISQHIKTLFPDAGAYISKLHFNAFGYHLYEMVLDETLDIEKVVGGGELTFVDGTRKSFHLCETDTVPQERVPYDEDSFVANATYEDITIRFDGPSPFTSIETVIALTKALSYRLMPLQSGKWVFGRLDLLMPLPAITTSVVITRTAVLGNRFSVNKIEIDGQHVGQIRFIVGTP